MPRYLLPVRGLTVIEPWTVGTTTVVSGQALRDRLIAEAQSDERGDALVAWMQDTIDSITAGAAIEVPAESLESAMAVASDALGCLRLFQYNSTPYTTGLFGLPDEVANARLDYFELNDGAVIERTGARQSRQYVGTTLTSQELSTWAQSKGYQFLSDIIGRPAGSEGEQRAVRAMRLLDQALLQRSHELRFLSCVFAMEAMLIPQSDRGQTLALARAGAARMCPRSCTEHESPCPYVKFDPQSRPDRKKLEKLQAIMHDLQDGGVGLRIRCSTWNEITAWYALRSDIAHGKNVTMDDRFARQTMWRISNHLFQPLLEWYSENTDDPVGKLLERLNELPPMAEDVQALVSQAIATAASAGQ